MAKKPQTKKKFRVRKLYVSQEEYDVEALDAESACRKVSAGGG